MFGEVGGRVSGSGSQGKGRGGVVTEQVVAAVCSGMKGAVNHDYMGIRVKIE